MLACSKNFFDIFKIQGYCSQVEIVLDDPILYIFHDVLTDNEMELMKAFSWATVILFPYFLNNTISFTKNKQ